MSIICKLFGHSYCPDNIHLTAGTSIVTILFKCKRCGKTYLKSYPSFWNSIMDWGGKNART
jgi:hypothetical protein